MVEFKVGDEVTFLGDTIQEIFIVEKVSATSIKLQGQFLEFAKHRFKLVNKTSTHLPEFLW